MNEQKNSIHFAEKDHQTRFFCYFFHQWKKVKEQKGELLTVFRFVIKKIKEKRQKLYRFKKNINQSL